MEQPGWIRFVGIGSKLENVPEEKGYIKRDIPTLILKNNLVGLDVDKRTSQLASFSLIMKARSMNNRFFDEEYYEKPHVFEIKDSKILIKQDYRMQIHDLNLLSVEERELIYYLVDTFEHGKTIGSLLVVRQIDFEMLDNAIEKMAKVYKERHFKNASV